MSAYLVNTERSYRMDTSTPITRVLIVDAQPLFALGVSSLLSSVGEFEVVGHAQTYREGAIMADAQRPDLLVLDSALPDACIEDALQRLRQSHPGMPIVLFSAKFRQWGLTAALKVGVRAFVTKRAGPEALLDAIRTVREGGQYVDPRAALLLMRGAGVAEQEEPPGGRLTCRELAVLKLVAGGMRNREISSQLFISERTVKFHISQVLQKLQANNRTQAVKLAIEAGLIET